MSNGLTENDWRENVVLPQTLIQVKSCRRFNVGFTKPVLIPAIMSLKLDVFKVDDGEKCVADLPVERLRAAEDNYNSYVKQFFPVDERVKNTSRLVSDGLQSP